jgi:hypothetical protein
MKYIRYLLVPLVIGATMQVKAQGESSRDPVLNDYKQLVKFRDVFYPLYNKFLPEHNYEVLLNAAPVLKTAAVEYSKMKYDTHHNVKLKAFQKYRDSLSLLVQAYEDAALRFDTSAACNLLPPMQEQFEKSAAVMIPYAWPEYTRVRKTAERLNEYLTRGARKKDPKSPKFDLAGTLDTLAVQMAAFSASPGPQEAQYRASLMTEEKAYFAKLVDEMKAQLALGPPQISLGQQDKFIMKAVELKVRLVTFERVYLQ